MPRKVEVTERALKALQILHDHALEQMEAGNRSSRGMTASQFGAKMWPKSPAWQRSYGGCSTDSGPVMGTGIVMSAGSWLHKLYYRGFVRYERANHANFWHLSAQGLTALQVYTRLQQLKKERKKPCRKKPK